MLTAGCWQLEALAAVAGRARVLPATDPESAGRSGVGRAPGLTQGITCPAPERASPRPGPLTPARPRQHDERGPGHRQARASTRPAAHLQPSTACHRSYAADLGLPGRAAAAPGNSGPGRYRLVFAHARTHSGRQDHPARTSPSEWPGPERGRRSARHGVAVSLWLTGESAWFDCLVARPRCARPLAPVRGSAAGVLAAGARRLCPRSAPPGAASPRRTSSTACGSPAR